MMSRKTKYGIRALIFLTQEKGRGPIQIREISERLGISLKFLEAILLELRKAHILQSHKGRKGGYFLKRPPHAINMSEVLRLLQGPIASVSCVSLTAYAPCTDCTDEKLCLIRQVMREVRDASLRILEKTTLDQLTRHGELPDSTLSTLVKSSLHD